MEYLRIICIHLLGHSLALGTSKQKKKEEMRSLKNSKNTASKQSTARKIQFQLNRNSILVWSKARTLQRNKNRNSRIAKKVNGLKIDYN